MKNLNSKSSDIIKKLARDLLKCTIGDKIPTTPEWSTQYSVGFGTIGKALDHLKEMKAIQLQSRGQMGTYLLDKNIHILWSVFDSGPVIGVLPLPNTIEFEGLATGFTEVFKENQIILDLSFQNGASIRIKQLLEQRCDFVVLSHESAMKAIADNPKLQLITVLGPKSYYSDVIVIRRKENKTKPSKWRIGVDTTSYDQIEFSKKLFPLNNHINVQYYHTPYLIAEGVIDAAIWHSSHLIPAGLIDKLCVENLEPSGVLEDINPMSAAVISHVDKQEGSELLHQICDALRLQGIQLEVLKRIRIPSY